MNQFKYDGINIDVENLYLIDRDFFSLLIKPEEIKVKK
ncbi:hypothetical protein KP78_15380 [Jeotgalibacillus soli]|uniref:Uncharacterized protein n=1 Tax=Jeotgalibacillus soli TaxID=889306 RepID=A0A0C2VXA3_9BACL|nr:hypothetical protein KP78_15380 [Jeotgalibacillus soli]